MLTRDDLIELAALVNLDPDLCNADDDQLLTLVMHEMYHAYMRQTHVALFRAMSPVVFVRYFADQRVLRGWMELVKDDLMPAPEPPPLTLADRLERAASADIFYDTDTFGDDYDAEGTPMSDLIGDAQDAMMMAARILREHGLDR